MSLLLVLLVFAIAACGGSSSDSQRNSDNLPGRGSKACRNWQDAICDYGADRCGISSREACDHQYQGATCKSDELAKICTSSLDKAGCGSATAGCMIDSVGDPAPAVQACDELVGALCDHYVACGQMDSNDACRMDADVVAIDCARAITYSLEYEQCIDEIDTWGCADDKPESCGQVIVLRNRM